MTAAHAFGSVLAMPTHVATVSLVLNTPHGAVSVPIRTCAGETKAAAKRLADSAVRDAGGSIGMLCEATLMGPGPNGAIGSLMKGHQFLAALGITSVGFKVDETEAKTSEIVAPVSSLIVSS